MSHDDVAAMLTVRHSDKHMCCLCRWHLLTVINWAHGTPTRHCYQSNMHF